MTVCSAAKRERPATLDATVTTLAVPGLGVPHSIFVLTDDTRLVSSDKKTIFVVIPSSGLVTLVGNKDEVGELKDGEGISAHFKNVGDLTVDRTDRWW